MQENFSKINPIGMIRYRFSRGITAKLLHCIGIKSQHWRKANHGVHQVHPLKTIRVRLSRHTKPRARITDHSKRVIPIRISVDTKTAATDIKILWIRPNSKSKKRISFRKFKTKTLCVRSELAQEEFDLKFLKNSTFRFVLSEIYHRIKEGNIPVLVILVNLHRKVNPKSYWTQQCRLWHRV